MPTTSNLDKAFVKLCKDTEGYHHVRDESRGFVDVYRHQDDERHLVVNNVTNKIVKRFRDAETSWSDAARFADDYFWEHRLTYGN